MVLQEGYPWEIEYTIWPIAIGAVVMTIKLIFCRDNGYWNREALSKGLISLAFAVYCFSQGLDEYKDYLRIYHGFWHVFVTIACFYLFQAHERETIQNWEFMKLLCYTNVKN
jgi:predicted membrane channel-forming protein YqfA (hemolysin III family)